MPQEWIVVPVERVDDNTYPMYWDTSGITGYSGAIMDFSADKWSDLPWHPDTMYVVRFSGSQSAFKTIAANDDAYRKREHGITDKEVAGYLDEKYGASHSFSEWLNRFNIPS